MKRLRIFWRIMKETGADKILTCFALFFLACAAVIWIWEPQIRTPGDALWYCYAVITTIGFGDVLVTTHIARFISVVLSVYAVLVLAIVTGVVVNYYNQIVQMKQSETLASVLDRMEHLQDLSPDELEELSNHIKALRKK